MKKISFAICLILSLAVILCGCFGNYYKVDYDGIKMCYDGARDYYRAGDTVTVYYSVIATDTDYSFYLDDESLHFSFDQNKGFVIQFIMPEHDVKLTCESVNTMVSFEQ